MQLAWIGSQGCFLLLCSPLTEVLCTYKIEIIELTTKKKKNCPGGGGWLCWLCLPVLVNRLLSRFSQRVNLLAVPVHTNNKQKRNIGKLIDKHGTRYNSRYRTTFMDWLPCYYYLFFLHTIREIDRCCEWWNSSPSLNNHLSQTAQKTCCLFVSIDIFVVM